MKRLIAIILMIALCAGILAGCAPAKVDEALVGTWTMQLDLAAPLVEMLQEKKMDALLKELDLSATKIDISFTFRADATYEADVDIAAIEQLSKATTKAVAAMPELEQQLKETGLDISSITKVLTTLFPEKEDGEQKATLSGKFKTEDSKLFLGLGKTITIYADGCTYTVDGEKLTISEMDGKTGESLKNVLPLEFKKA